MRGLFVEPFFGGSHRAFAEGLRRHSRHDIELLTLPEGEWRRRMRRGAQELAADALALRGTWDVLVVTDMLDLPAFLALTRPRFERTPVLLYFHENQLTYPRLRGTSFNSWFGQVNYLSALAANAVAFNSEFHREDFLGALRTLAGQPNNWLLPGRIDEIEAKSSILAVGVELAWLDEYQPPAEQPGGSPLVLWNHRWEFDKAPEVFARAVLRLAAEGHEFRVAIAGDPGLNPSSELAGLRDGLGERVVQFGRVEDAGAYARLLWASDIVVSTTRHEFFGMAMVEALYCGCFPVVPRRYNYPALVPEAHHGLALWDDERELFERLGNALRERPGLQSRRASAERFAWPRVAPEWDTAIDSMAMR